MRPEDPDELLAGSGLSSEEYLQCLLTMLIIGGPYPTWNTRSVPSPEGRRFLQLLDALSFDSASEARGAVFIDEFDLPKRPKDAAGRAPDWCVLTGTRLWMIELKTLAGSHDPGQLPAFLELAKHHYPNRFIDLTYITPPLTKPAPELGGRMRYRHLTWKQVRPLLIRVWGRATAGSRDRRLLDAANAVIDSLGQPWLAWRDVRLQTLGLTEPAVGGGVLREPTTTGGPRPSSGEPNADVESVAAQVAADHQQRAVTVAAGSLQDLYDQSRSIGDSLAQHPDPTLRHVQPWVWQPSSQGHPLTALGRDTGFELRLS
jgi:hypothetical protein